MSGVLADHNNPKPSLKARLQADDILVVPGCYDALSARLIEQAGFEAVYVTGNGHAASHLGLPDTGFMTQTEIVERIHHVAASVSLPVIADGDTGYGSPLSVRRTVQLFEEAGASAIQLEDQQDPKKCGHELGRYVIEPREMAAKVWAAANARRSDEMLIIARTDARTTHGLDEAIRRSLLYAEAGADILFIESPESEEELRLIPGRLPRPVLANMVEDGRTPYLSASTLHEYGFRLALFPLTAILAATWGVREVMATLRRDGTAQARRPQMLNLREYHDLTGWPAVRQLEARQQRWLDEFEAAQVDGKGHSR